MQIKLDDWSVVPPGENIPDNCLVDVAQFAETPLSLIDSAFLSTKFHENIQFKNSSSDHKTLLEKPSDFFKN